MRKSHTQNSKKKHNIIYTVDRMKQKFQTLTMQTKIEIKKKLIHQEITKT